MRLSEYLKGIIDATLNPIENLFNPNKEEHKNAEIEFYRTAAEIEHQLNKDRR